MWPLDLQWLCMSLLPRVLATMMPPVLPIFILQVFKRTIGSRFALGVVEFRPQSDCVMN